MAEHSTGMSPRPILLVDDDPAIRATTRRMLSGEGYVVLEAETGAQALNILHTHPAPLIVLTNHTMPQLNGPDLLQRVLEEPSLQMDPSLVTLMHSSRGAQWRKWCRHLHLIRTISVHPGAPPVHGRDNSRVLSGTRVSQGGRVDAASSVKQCTTAHS